MHTVSAHDVAAYILEKTGEISTMKLQKLLYYCQGWSLAWDGIALFREPIEAQTSGPLVHDVAMGHRGQFTVYAWLQGNPYNLSIDQCETVDIVLEAYGKLSGQQLMDKTLCERPWQEAQKDTPLGLASKAPLSLNIMKEYFMSLAARTLSSKESA